MWLVSLTITSTAGGSPRADTLLIDYVFTLFRLRFPVCVLDLFGAPCSRITGLSDGYCGVLVVGRGDESVEILSRG